MADYKFGSMDTTAQENAFNGFVKFSTRSVIAILIVLALLGIFAT